MDADFIVAVRAGTVSRTPDESKDGALLDLLAFRDEFRDDVEHGIILSMYVDSGTKKALAEASASDFKW